MVMSESAVNAAFFICENRVNEWDLRGYSAPVTYNFETKEFYVKPESKGEVLRSLQDSLSICFQFASSGYVTGYGNLAMKIAMKTTEKYENLIFNEEGKLDLVELAPGIRGTIPKEAEDLDEFRSKLISNFVKQGYGAFDTSLIKKLDKEIDFYKGNELYKKMLEVPVGHMNVRGVFDLVLKECVWEYIERGECGWGERLFGYAAVVGMEKEVEEEFVNRIQQVYNHSYGAALTYFSQYYKPQKAHEMSMQTIENTQRNFGFLFQGGFAEDSHYLRELSNTTLRAAQKMRENDAHAELSPPSLAYA